MAAKQTKSLKWSVPVIRQEIARLDSITGLNGSAVTVRLYAEREPLGCFTFKDPVRMTFGFSSTRFEEPGFTAAEALDIIRHEYAHFMEYKLSGESSDHGPNWVKCCLKIGAHPDKLYTAARRDAARREEKDRTRTDGFTVGTAVSHRVFGTGVVESIDRAQQITKLTIRFPSGTKVLDIDWVRKNCPVLPKEP